MSGWRLERPIDIDLNQGRARNPLRAVPGCKINGRLSTLAAGRGHVERGKTARPTGKPSGIKVD